MDQQKLSHRYQQILDQVKQAKIKRGPGLEVTLIAVSKKQSVNAIEELYRLGHRDFGENYAQELAAKAQELQNRGCVEIRWHFIGHLQTNKVKMILPYVYCIHTVDSEKLAIKVAELWKKQSQGESLPVFIEVNVDQEMGKAGIAPEEIEGIVLKLKNLPQLNLQGLMCIPAARESSAPAFQRLRELLNPLAGATSARNLSMGMSNDFQVAIQEGATHIRVGTALFGKRT